MDVKKRTCRKCHIEIDYTKYGYCNACFRALGKWLKQNDLYIAEEIRRGRDDYAGYIDPTCRLSERGQ